MVSNYVDFLSKMEVMEFSQSMWCAKGFPFYVALDKLLLVNAMGCSTVLYGASSHQKSMPSPTLKRTVPRAIPEDLSLGTRVSVCHRISYMCLV